MNNRQVCTIVTGNSNSGSACIDQLLTSSTNQFTVRAAFRTNEKAKPYQEKYPQLEIVCGIDASQPETLEKAFLGAHSALIVTVHDPKRGFKEDAILTENMINAAVDNGVQYLVLVASWTVLESHKIPIISARFKPLEVLLENLGKEKGLKWTVLRGGFFMENTLPALLHVKTGSDVFSSPKYCVPMVDTVDIGKSAAACLSAIDQNEHCGKYYSMNGPRYLSGEDVAKCISTCLNRQIKYKELTKEEYHKIMPEGVAQVFDYLEEMGEKAIPLKEDVKNLTGQNGSFEIFLKRNFGDFC